LAVALLTGRRYRERNAPQRYGKIGVMRWGRFVPALVCCGAGCADLSGLSGDSDGGGGPDAGRSGRSRRWRAGRRAHPADAADGAENLRCPEEDPNDAGAPVGPSTVGSCGDASPILYDNNLHCGACFRACAPPESCGGTACSTEQLWIDPQFRVLRAVAGGYAYFTTGAGVGGDVERTTALPADGGILAEAVFTAPPNVAVRSMVRDPSNGEVYVSTTDGIVAVNPGMHAERAITSTGGAFLLALASTDVIYEDQLGSQVLRVAKSGVGGPSFVATAASPLHSLVADDRGEAWVSDLADAGAPRALFVHVAGAPVALYPLSETDPAIPAPIVMTQTYVYAADGDSLYRFSRSGTPSAGVRTGGWPNATFNQGIAVAGDYVYWLPAYSPETGATNSNIVRTPRCGGQTIAIGTPPPNVPSGLLLVEGGYVYFMQSNDPRGLVRVTP
jgi:hypothetical protein